MNNSRRSFLKRMFVGSAVLPFTLSPVAKALAASMNDSAYKAVVFIKLVGGNDSLNMLVPTKDEVANTDFTEKGYSTYALQRENLKVANNLLDINSYLTDENVELASNPYHVDGSSESSYTKGIFSLDSKNIPLGVNSLMPELAQLIQQDKVSVLANIGTLVEPITRAEVKAGNQNYPPFIFSHNSQRKVIQTGIADDIYASGWAGRIADIWQSSYEDKLIKFGISYAGTSSLLSGESAPYMVLASGEPTVFDSLDDEKSALLDALNGQGSDDPLKRVVGETIVSSKDDFNALLTTWESTKPVYSSTDPYGNPLFTSYSSNSEIQIDSDLRGELLEQLETVAHMMRIAKSENLPAQVFYVELNGFDHHADQAAKHPLLLRELSLALYSFEKSLTELGLFNDVVTLTTSDFGRTAVENSSGTDHAWGSQQLIMGGAIQGGEMFGQLPSLLSEGADDAAQAGRIIPTTAYEQVFAPVVSWLGLPAEKMLDIFPNLTNFKTDDDLTSAYVPVIA